MGLKKQLKLLLAGVVLISNLPAVASTVFKADFEDGTTNASVGTLNVTNGTPQSATVVNNSSTLNWGAKTLKIDKVADSYKAELLPSATVSLSSTTLSFEFVQMRYSATKNDKKSHFITAYDSNGKIAFQLKVADTDYDLNKTKVRQSRTIAYLDSHWGESIFTPEQIAVGKRPESNPGADNTYAYFFGQNSTSENPNSNNAARFVVTTSAKGWTLSATPYDNSSLSPFTTIEMPFHDANVQNIAKVVISGESALSGAYWDNLQIDGTADTASTIPVVGSDNLPAEIVAHDTTASYTTIKDKNNSSYKVRGQSFTLPARTDANTTKSWDVSGLSVNIKQGYDFSSLPNAKLKLWLFEMPNSADANDLSAWNNATGTTVNDLFEGTTVTNFYLKEHSYPINFRVVAGDIYLPFPNAIQLPENKAYGFLIALDDGDEAQDAANLRLSIARAADGSAYASGKMLALESTKANTGNQETDDLSFKIHGITTPQPAITFYPDRQAGPTFKRFGWDLKGNKGLTDTDNEARIMYEDTPANLIRLPVFAAAHYADGTVDETLYEKVVKSVTKAKKFQPNVEVFVSMKLDGANSFIGPVGEENWFTAGDSEWPQTTGKVFGKTVFRPTPVHFAKLWADAINYFRSKGIEIDYLGVNNECEHAFEAARYVATVRELKSILKDEPYNDLNDYKYIAPDAYHPWDSRDYLVAIKNLDETALSDTVDIIGSHSYFRTTAHTANYWTETSTLTGISEMWHTEAHINGTDNVANVGRMRMGAALLFASNMAGIDSTVIWAGGSNSKFDKIFKRRLATTMVNAYPAVSPYFDEQPEAINPNADREERVFIDPMYQAYVQDKTVWLWVANPDNVAVDDQPLQIVSEKFGKPEAITTEYWAGEGNVLKTVDPAGLIETGSLTLTQSSDGKTLTVDLPARSISLVKLEYPETQLINEGETSSSMSGATFSANQGSGSLRVEFPSANNVTGITTEDLDLSAAVKQRLKKSWDVTAIDSATGSISFNKEEVGIIVGADVNKLKLIYRPFIPARRSANNFVEVSGATVADNGDSVTFSSVSFADGEYSLGSTESEVLTPAIGIEVSLSGSELVWTVEEEVDVKEYVINYSVNGESKSITVTANGSEVYQEILEEGAENVVLTVVDNSGFADSYVPADGNILIEVYDLEEGWNLIAITSDDADLETLRDETVGVLWGWNGSGYEVIETASATDAVWVYAPTAKQVYISGTKSTAQIELSIGWNMVGPVENDYIPAGADTVYSWSKVYDEIVGDSKVLIGGKGYWIFSL